jgi:integrase
VQTVGKDTRLDQVTPELYQAWLGSLTARALTAGTLSQYVKRVVALYHWHARTEERAAQRERRSARHLYSPVDPESVPKPQGGRVRFLTAEEAEKLWAATPERLRFAVGCGLHAGLRLLEILTLRPTHRCRPGVRHPLRPVAAGLATQESKRNREVPMTPALVALAEAQVARFASDRWMTPSPLEPTEHFSRNAFAEQFRRIVEAAGLTFGARDASGVTVHTLRHTFASHIW